MGHGGATTAFLLLCVVQLACRSSAMSLTARTATLAKAMETAVVAVKEATAAARSVADTFQSFEREGSSVVIGKQDTSPVTVADFAVQAVVCRRLMRAFPDDPVIAEEDADELRRNPELRDHVVRAVRVVEPAATGELVCDWIDRGTAREYSQRFWTLDPIDGTKGFLRREQYAVCLALIEDGVPSAGSMACPNLPPILGDPDAPAEERKGSLFCAHTGGGAWQVGMPELREGEDQDDEADEERKPLRLGDASVDKPTDSLRFCESVESSHSNHDLSSIIASALRISRPPLRLDSQVKYGILARGEADIYLRLPRPSRGGGDTEDDDGPLKVGDSTYRENIWDHAVGTLVLSEAGGFVTDMNGFQLDFRHGSKLVKNRGVVASTGSALHDRLLAAIASSTASAP